MVLNDNQIVTGWLSFQLQRSMYNYLVTPNELKHLTSIDIRSIHSYLRCQSLPSIYNVMIISWVLYESIDTYITTDFDITHFYYSAAKEMYEFLETEDVIKTLYSDIAYFRVETDLGLRRPSPFPYTGCADHLYDPYKYELRCSIIQKLFAIKLREMMDRKNLSVRDLVCTGISRKTLYNYINGSTTPTILNISRIACRCNAEPSELIDQAFLGWIWDRSCTVLERILDFVSKPNARYTDELYRLASK